MYNDRDYRSNLVDTTCAGCGKNFIPAPFHRYKDGPKLYCGWHCYNHRDRRNHHRGKKTNAVAQYDMNGNLVKTFVSINEASEYTGHHVDTLRGYIDRNVSAGGYFYKVVKGEENEKIHTHK